MKIFFILLVLGVAAKALPQNWPYRDNHEYYGYQNRGNNFYRASNIGSVEDDDEVEAGRPRQDLKVGGQSPAVAASVPASTNSAAQPVVVVETGSAKPVVAAEPNIKQATQPVDPNKQTQQQPAFPPATPPATPSPTDEDSEEDSDEEDEADVDDQEQDDDDEDEGDEDDNRRRNDPVVVETNKNVTTVTSTTPASVPKKKPVKKENRPVQTVEALVPGYVTEQGEVLVPFDTVVKDQGQGVVAVVEDPSYVQNQPPVVVLPTESASIPDRPVPKFFNPNGERQLYYSEVPPPGAIFTFDDDNEIEDDSRWIGRRQGETSSEETQDDESESAQDDDASEEEEPAASRPPLSFVKATAPSGEDDEAESLGIRIARASGYDPRFHAFYGSRSPNYFYHGNGYYVTRYPSPNYYDRNDYNVGVRENEYRPQPTYYYRPASNEKVRVVPIASFDVNLEQDLDSGEVKAVVSPFNRRPPSPMIRRRPTPNRVVIRRGDNRPSFGTPVIRQRNNNKQRREAKELKKKKKDSLVTINKKKKEEKFVKS